jgi:hypothetical protein
MCLPLQGFSGVDVVVVYKAGRGVGTVSQPRSWRRLWQGRRLSSESRVRLHFHSVDWAEGQTGWVQFWEWDKALTQIVPTCFVTESIFLIHIATWLSPTLLHPPAHVNCSNFCLFITLSALENSRECLETTLCVLLIILKFIAAENKIFVDVQPHLISLSASVML